MTLSFFFFHLTVLSDLLVLYTNRLYNKKNGFAREKYDKFGFLLFYFVKFLLKYVLGIDKFAKVSFEEYFWVDTGALYTFIPEDRLNDIGLEPVSSRNLILADGRRDKRLVGEALLTIEDLQETMTCPVIFAPKGSLYLLGATALETFGVDVDPVSKKLKPILGIIGGFLSSR